MTLQAPEQIAGTKGASMRTYDLRKGTRIRLMDERQGELFDSSRRLVRHVKLDDRDRLELIMSFDIAAYLGEDSEWHDDLQYSREERAQRRRKEASSGRSSRPQPGKKPSSRSSALGLTTDSSDRFLDVLDELYLLHGP